MEKTNYSNVLTNDWRTVVLIIGITVVFSLVLTLIQPFRYQSSVRVLVIQKQAQGMDPYTAIKSAERVSQNLAEVTYTTSFFDKVMASGFDINGFSQDENKRRKQWKKTIKTQAAYDSGMIKINVFHKSHVQATRIASAIAHVLNAQGGEYLGIEDLEIKIVDSVLTSKYPVKPNIVLNLLSSMVLGSLVGTGFVILNSNRTKEKNIFKEVRKKDEAVLIEDIDKEKMISEITEEDFFKNKNDSSAIQIKTIHDHLDINNPAKRDKSRKDKYPWGI